MSELKKLITKKYLIALIVIAILDTLSFASLLLAINLNKDLAYLVNISGKQRMLSKEITLYVHQYQLAKIDKEKESIKKDALERMALFKKRHLILTSKLKDSDHPSIPYRILEFYRQEKGLDQKSNYFLEQSKLFLNTTPTNEELKSYSEFVKTPFYLDLDQAVQLFENEANTLNQILIYIEVVIYLLSFLNLAFILKLILIPMRDSIVKREGELSSMVYKLKEEGKYKSMFLANMGHELRTPLNGILGVTDLLQDSPLEDEQKELIKIIESSGANLLHIVDDILDLTKLDMGEVVLEKRDFSPEAFLSDLTRSFKILSEQKNIEFEWEKHKLPLLLNGDEHRLKQVFNNLLGNALKFTTEGSIKMTTKYDEYTSTFMANIHDTGIGISKDKLDLIFDPFKQADSSTTRLHGGTGLGLSISRRFVQAMGGTLKVTSEVGIGSTFSISIPMRKHSSDRIYTVADQQSDDSYIGDVLLIDAEDESRSTITRSITNYGGLVESALSTKVAHRLLATRNYQMALINTSIKTENLLESLEFFIKKVPQNTKIYLLSTEVELELNETIRERISDIIQLPIEDRVLIDLIKSNLKKA